MQFDKSFPIIMRGLMTTEDWVAMSWSPKDWCQALSCDTVRVRSGQVDPKLDHPQWERYTCTKDLKSEDFFNENWRQKHISENEWCYFDYQYLHQIMDPDTLKLFSWAKLGLSERDGSDSTFWAGTRGSHTPCHQDSYGCNLVCQISGTKEWTLFSPDDSQNLAPTRIPYEESSIYSKINFINLERNPQKSLDRLSQATSYKVSLNPGDVLFVPHQWWHQVVTTSDFSVSINTWVPAPGDNMARLKEALTRWQIANVVKNLQDETLKKYILNPNEDDLIDTPIEELSKIINLTLKDVKETDTNEYCDFNKIKFADKYEKLESSSMIIPKSTLKVGDGVMSENLLLRTVDSLVNDNVLQVAVNNLLIK